MANVVAYDLEREIGIDRPLHTGVTKAMRARARDRNSRIAQIMPAVPQSLRSLCAGELANLDRQWNSVM